MDKKKSTERQPPVEEKKTISEPALNASDIDSEIKGQANVPPKKQKKMEENPLPVEKNKATKDTSAPPPLKITARQFARAKRFRWEKSAGFLHYATIKFGKNKRFSVSEWSVHWDTFWSQPAGRPIKEV